MLSLTGLSAYLHAGNVTARLKRYRGKDIVTGNRRYGSKFQWKTAQAEQGTVVRLL